MKNESETIIEQRVKSEQNLLLFKSMPVALAGTLISAICSYFFLINYFKISYVLIWFLLILSAVSLRFLSYLYFLSKFKKYNLDIFKSSLNVFFVHVGTAVTGLLWGIMGFYFFIPENNFTNTMIALITGGLAAVSTTTLSYRKLTSTLFISAVIFPNLTVNVLNANQDNYFIILFLAIIFIFSIRGSFFIQNIIRKNIRTGLIYNIEKENSKKYQNLISEMQKETEKAETVKSDFLSHMSHELRTPMNSIMGFAQLLKLSSGNNLSDDQKLFIEEIFKNSKNLLNGIENLLHLKEIEKGILEIKIKKINLTELVQQSIDLLYEEASKNEIQINNHLSGDSEIEIFGDSIRVKQVLINVILNAIQYNKIGGSVQIQRDDTRDHFTGIQIIDTGIGLNEYEIEEIFQNFTRFGKDNVNGTGIGLSISQKLLDLMGGEIIIKSEKNTGTVITIFLKKQLCPEDPSGGKFLDTENFSCAKS